MTLLNYWVKVTDALKPLCYQFSDICVAEILWHCSNVLICKNHRNYMYKLLQKILLLLSFFVFYDILFLLLFDIAFCFICIVVWFDINRIIT